MLALILVALAVAPVPGSARVALGRPPGTEVEVSLQEGRLVIQRDAATLLYASGADLYVLGFAAAALTQPREQELVVWFVRRDRNVDGVTPHDSGWMSSSTTPWLATHVGVLALSEGALVFRWTSSSTPGIVEHLETIPAANASGTASLRVFERIDGILEDRRYHFEGFRFQLDARAVVTSAGPPPPDVPTELTLSAGTCSQTTVPHLAPGQATASLSGLRFATLDVQVDSLQNSAERLIEEGVHGVIRFAHEAEPIQRVGNGFIATSRPTTCLTLKVRWHPKLGTGAVDISGAAAPSSPSTARVAQKRGRPYVGTTARRREPPPTPRRESGR